MYHSWWCALHRKAQISTNTKHDVLVFEWYTSWWTMKSPYVSIAKGSWDDFVEWTRSDSWIGFWSMILDSRHRCFCWLHVVFLEYDECQYIIVWSVSCTPSNTRVHICMPCSPIHWFVFHVFSCPRRDVSILSFDLNDGPHSCRIPQRDVLVFLVTPVVNAGNECVFLSLYSPVFILHHCKHGCAWISSCSKTLLLLVLSQRWS